MLGRGGLMRRRKRARLRFFPSVLLSPVSPGAFLPSESPVSGSFTKRRLYPARPSRAPVAPALRAGPAEAAPLGAAQDLRWLAARLLAGRHHYRLVGGQRPAW